jgi:CRP/FNR family transcriptional regulator, cyclic AMP receptor protein
VPRALIGVLEEDPELGEGLARERLASARQHARAEMIDVVSKLPTTWPANLRSGPGLLVLDGLLLRRVGLDGRFGAELLGRGDLLRPWQIEDTGNSLPQTSGWRVLQRARVALLDLDFTRRIAAYPEIHGQLIARAIRRSRYLALSMAIMHHPKVETRLHLLLWHLADRWGRVHPDAVHLPVKLTHVVLSELVGARRPTGHGGAHRALRRAAGSGNVDAWIALQSRMLDRRRPCSDS